MKQILAIGLLAIAFAACTKEEQTPARDTYVYKVTCDSCQVKYLNPLSIYQNEVAVGSWEHTIYAAPGQQVSVTAYNTSDTTAIHAAILKDSDQLTAGDQTGADAVVTLTVTADQ